MFGYDNQNTMKLLSYAALILLSKFLNAARTQNEDIQKRNTESDKIENKVVGIIGGGASGLYAGLLLDSLNIDYTIIEASDRLGGRIFTYKFDPNLQQGSDGDCHQFMYTNLGAAFFAKSDLMKRVTGNESWSLINFLNKHTKDAYKIEVIPGFLSEPKNVNSFNGITARTEDSRNNYDVYHLSRSHGGLIPDDFVRISSTRLLYEPFSSILKRLKQNFTGEIINVINEYDHLTVSQFLQLNYTNRQPYTEDETDYLEKVSASSYDFSASMVEMVLYLLNSFDPDEGVVKIHGGTYNIIRAMVSLLKGQVVRDVVTRVECDQDRKVVVKTKRGSQYKFDYLITTPTLKALSKIDFSSSCEISDAKMTAIKTATYGHSTNIALKFNHKFWEDSELMNGQPHFTGIAVTDLPIGTVIYNEDGINCTASNGMKPGTVRLYSHGKGAFNGSIDLILENFEKIHGPLTRSYFSGEYFVQKWTTHPYTLGGWAEFEPNFYSKYYKLLSLPEFNRRIHVAGEGTSIFHGWVLGALNSAYRAVRNIITNEDSSAVDNFEKLWGPYNEPKF